jgi:hypothetical protein
MKRVDLVRHLEAHGCALLREGGRHSVFVNRAAGKSQDLQGSGDRVGQVMADGIDR